MNPNPAPTTKLVKVTLQQPGHKHNGQPVAIGETIEVDEPTAAWLKANGKLDRTPAAPAASKPAQENA